MSICGGGASHDVKCSMVNVHESAFGESTVGQALSPSAVAKGSLCVFYWSSWSIRYLCHTHTHTHTHMLWQCVPFLRADDHSVRAASWFRRGGGREGQIPQCGVRYLMADVLTLEVKAGCVHVVAGSTVSLSIDQVF